MNGTKKRKLLKQRKKNLRKPKKVSAQALCRNYVFANLY